MTEPDPTPPTLQGVRDAVQELTVEARSLRAAMRRQNLLLGSVIAVALAAICALAWVSWDNHLTTDKLQRVTAANQAEIAANNRLWCPTLGAIIQPAGPPPTTERSQTTVDLLSQLFVRFCTPNDLPK